MEISKTEFVVIDLDIKNNIIHFIRLTPFDIKH